MELIPADGKCIVASDGTIVWCDAIFSEWFSYRGIGAGSKFSQLFSKLGQLSPGAQSLCKPGAVYEDTDKLGKRRYFAMECRPTFGMAGEKASDDIRIRKITLEKVLSDIPRMATQAKGPQELFEKVLWLLRDTTHYLAFAGYIARDGRVELVASKGWTEKLKSYISLQPIAPDSPSLVGRSAYHRQQIVMAMKDYALTPAVKAAINKLGGEYIVVTPLLDQDKLVGVLTVINDKVLTPSDSEALSAICGQVAAALNLKLQEEAAVLRADDAVLKANLIARTMRDRASVLECRRGEGTPVDVLGPGVEALEPGIKELLRAMNDNIDLPGISLKDAVAYAVSSAKLLAEASHKKLNVHLAGLDDTQVSPLFKYAVYEALKNSVQHSSSGSVDADIRLVKDRSGGARLEISDNGPGIPDEFKSEVFRPIKENVKNPLGMGLYLVKKIANRYGGRVWIEDRVHGDHKKGASVVITLPGKA